MIERPTYTAQQQEEIKEVYAMEGWNHIITPVFDSIRQTESDLINFEFERNENGRYTGKSISNYERKQLELVVMKIFKDILSNPILSDNIESEEIFENTSRDF